MGRAWWTASPATPIAPFWAAAGAGAGAGALSAGFVPLVLVVSFYLLLLVVGRR